MGLTSALNTSLNGLALNENTIDVLGNNIANAGTNGFKAANVRFQTQLSRTMSVGSRPTASAGGTNPRQVGLGASVSVISRDFTQGSVSNSTSPSDLAIQGTGFFVLNGANGIVYSRNGNFSLNSESALVNDQGMFVQGYGVDRDFKLVTTELSDLSIPLGNMHVSQQTANVELGGALLSTGKIGDRGSLITSKQLLELDPAFVPDPLNPTLTATLVPATATTKLLDLKDSAGQPLYTANQVIQFTGQKGGRNIDEAKFTVDAASDVQDMMTYLDDTLAIQSGGTVPNDARGGPPGVTLSGGVITIVGNAGLVNDIDPAVDALGVISLFQKSQADADGDQIPDGDAVGEGTGFDFTFYDSLGQPIPGRLTTSLESRAPGATTYRWYIECADDASSDVAIATGTIEFDSKGVVVKGGNATIFLDRSHTAAASPMQVTLDFTGIAGNSTAASLSVDKQDGSPPGTLQNFVIDESGIINGVFDNGMIRTLGQVVLARFANPDGLIEDGSTTFKEGVSSGSPFYVAPSTFGVGSLRAGAIELSNTDIGKGLVDLIVASTNYRGNARVISSVQNLVDELLQLGR